MDSFSYANSNAFSTNFFKVFTFYNFKSLNHSSAQDLPNKKTAALSVFFGRRYSSDNLPKLGIASRPMPPE
jgi:hypothetical protein